MNGTGCTGCGKTLAWLVHAASSQNLVDPARVGGEVQKQAVILWCNLGAANFDGPSGTANSSPDGLYADAAHW